MVADDESFVCVAMSLYYQDDVFDNLSVPADITQSLPKTSGDGSDDEYVPGMGEGEVDEYEHGVDHDLGDADATHLSKVQETAGDTTDCSGDIEDGDRGEDAEKTYDEYCAEFDAKQRAKAKIWAADRVRQLALIHRC